MKKSIKRFGLIGYPLGHSFSKKYFTEKFEREGLDNFVYDLFPLQSINELPQVIAEHPDLHGLNVTIPYKQEVLSYLHSSHLPSGVNACNCMIVNEGRLTGYNTDLIGFEKSFSMLLLPHHKKALVLGNGGATVAVTHVLGRLGITFEVVSRQLHTGSTLTYQQVTPQVINEHTIIINCTPVGTVPNINECPEIPYEAIKASHYLFDLIYNPGETLFLKKGKERGASTKNGYEMLVIQAEESWKIWNAV